MPDGSSPSFLRVYGASPTKLWLGDGSQRLLTLSADGTLSSLTPTPTISESGTVVDPWGEGVYYRTSSGLFRNDGRDAGSDKVDLGSPTGLTPELVPTRFGLFARLGNTLVRSSPGLPPETVMSRLTRPDPQIGLPTTDRDGTPYFTAAAENGSGASPYTSDGTAAGTHLVEEKGSLTHSGAVVAHRGMLFVCEGNSLYRIDRQGTATRLSEGQGLDTCDMLLAGRDRLFYRKMIDLNGSELWLSQAGATARRALSLQGGLTPVGTWDDRLLAADYTDRMDLKLFVSNEAANEMVEVAGALTGTPVETVRGGDLFFMTGQFPKALLWRVRRGQSSATRVEGIPEGVTGIKVFGDQLAVTTNAALYLITVDGAPPDPDLGEPPPCGCQAAATPPWLGLLAVVMARRQRRRASLPA